MKISKSKLDLDAENTPRGTQGAVAFSWRKGKESSAQKKLTQATKAETCIVFKMRGDDATLRIGREM